MGWYACLTILADVLNHLDLIPPDPKSNSESGWILMHAGLLSFIPIIQL
jgi:hypothetical protein